MAVTVNILTRYIDADLKRAERDLERFAKRAAAQQGSLQRRLLETGARMQRVGDAVASAGRRLTLGVTLPVAGAIAWSARAAAAERANMQRLELVLRNTTGATDAQVAAVERWVTQTQYATAVADDQLRPALATLVAATHDVGRAQDLLSVSLDIAAAKGRPVEQVATAMAKAYMGNVGALSRLGIRTRDASGEMMSFEQAVADARKAYAGAAREFGRSAEGSLQQLRNVISDLAESFGMVLLPYVRRAAQWLIALLKRFEGLSPRAKRVAVTIGLIAAAAGPALVVIGKLTSGVGLLLRTLGALEATYRAAMVAPWQASLGPMQAWYTAMRNGQGVIGATRYALDTLARGMGLAGAASLGWGAVIVGVIAALVLLYVKCEWFRKAVNKVLGAVGGVFRAFGRAVSAVFGWVKRHWRGLLDAFLIATGPIGWIVAWVIHHWDKCKAALSRVFDAIRKAWDWLWAHFRKTPVGQIVMRVAGAFGRLVGYVREHWQEIVRAVADAVNAIGRLINKAFGWTGIKVPTVSWGYSRGGSSRTGKTHGAVAARRGDPYGGRRPRTGDALSSAVGWVAGKVGDAVDWLGASIGDIVGFLASHLRLPRLPGPLARLLPALLQRVASALKRRITGAIGGGGAYGWAHALARRFGLVVTSTYRPGAVTAAGYRSDHAVYGRAADLAGPPAAMARLWRFLVQTAGSWKQAIYQHSILDGGRVGYYAPSDHFDHVHVARRGVGDYSGPALRPAWATAGPSVREVHVHVHLPGGTALVGEAERVGEVLAPHVARAIDRAERRRLRG